MENYITMSQKEIKRYDLIKKLIKQELKGAEAAQLLNLTTRHIRRLKKRVKEQGIQGLVHGNRGKSSNHSLPTQEKQKIIGLLHKHYFDFGPTLAAEKLTERHQINRDKGTIRSLMINEGLWRPKNKKKEKHRQWRQRKACCGEMIQYDGSYEHWFEDRGEKCCLLAAIDDATSQVWAQFDEHEGVFPTFAFWRGYIERFGKPYAVYIDKFSTYSVNHKIAQENPDTLTQFQRALEKGLNIAIIHAQSAQAKGRVEKLFKTLQDRLTKELRLNDISTIKEANNFLVNEYLSKFNAKFMVEPRSGANLHQKLTKQEENKLDSIFSRQYTRTIRNDFTIDHNKQHFQLLKDQPVTICKQDKVTVEERMDQTIQFRLRGRYLNYQLLPERPKRINQDKANLTWVIPKTVTYKPATNHPWRQTARMEYLKKQQILIKNGRF